MRICKTGENLVIG